MTRKLTLSLAAEDEKELSNLCAAIGFPPEAAAVYAVRLVSACVREGLFSDVSPCAWPKEAQLPGLFDTGTGGKVLHFRRIARDED